MVDARVWKQVEDEAREPPVSFLEYLPIRIAMEGGRMDPRRAEKVMEVYSPSILKLVSSLVSPPPLPRCHLHVLVGSSCGHRTFFLELLLVTFVVTLGRR
jgi:hypothetical protein